MRQRAERRRAHPDAAVDGGWQAIAELGGKRVDGSNLPAAGVGEIGDREVPQRRPRLVPAFQHRRQPAGVHESGVVQRQQQRRQQGRITAGADEMMGVRNARRFAAARIDHGQAAAARLHFGDAALHVGHGPHAAIRCQRIAAEDHQMLRALDIGNREQRIVAIEKILRQLVRHLIDGGRRIDSPNPQRLLQRAGLHAQREIMCGGVANIERCRAARSLDGSEFRTDFRKRRFPLQRHPVFTHPLHWTGQPVGICFQIGNGIALGADMAARDRIVGVAAYADDAAAFGFDQQSAIGFADVARACVDRHGGNLPLTSLSAPPPNGDRLCAGRCVR